MYRKMVGFVLFILLGFAINIQAWELPWKKSKIQEEQKKDTSEKASITLTSKPAKLQIRKLASSKFKNYEDLIQKNLELRNKLRVLEDNFTSLSNERNALILHTRKLQKEKKDIIKAAEHLDQTPKVVSEWRDRIKKVNEKLDTITKDRDNLQKQLDSSKKRLSELNGIIMDEVKRRVDDIKTEGSALFRELQDKSLNYVEEITKIKVKFSKEKIEMQNKIKKMEKEWQTLTYSNSLAEEEKKESNIEIKRLKETIKNKNTMLKVQDADIKDLAKKKKILEGTLKKEEDRREKLSGRIEEIEDKIKGLEKAIKNKDKVLKARDAKIGEMKKTLDKEKDNRKKTENKYAKLGEKLEKEQARIKKLEDERKKLKAKSIIIKPEKKKRRVKKAFDAAEDELINEKARKTAIKIHYNLAVAFDERGLYENAEKEYLECLEIDPEDADVHFNLGILYDDKLNDNVRALEHYYKFLKLRPMGADASDVRNWILNTEQETRLGVEVKS